jgi:hypothetical protein
MISFAFVNSDGIPTAGGSLPNLPEGAIPLTAPFTTLDLTRIRWRKGSWEERDDIAPPGPPTESELVAEAVARLAFARTSATARVNATVGDLRRRFYTDIPGQDALYLEKRAEAVAYVEASLGPAGEPATLDAFPFMVGEVGVTAPTAWQLAQLWLHLSDQFRAIGVATEQIRIRATLGIAGAADEEAIAQIESEFTQALTGLPI